MFDDEVREQIFAKRELQKIDLMTLSLVQAYPSWRIWTETTEITGMTAHGFGSLS